MRPRHLNRTLGSFLVAWIVACGHPIAESDAEREQIPAPAEVRAVRVVDAERLVLRIGEREVKVRLIGVDARSARRLGCPTDEGSVDELVEGAHLRIVRDSLAKDDEGRTWVALVR